MRTAVLGLVVALAVPAAARADFTAPELFIAESDSSSTQSNPPNWMPLDGAKLTGAYRYRLGVRVQPNSDSLGREYVLVQSVTSPQTPQHNATAIVPGAGSCASVRGTGDIVQFAQASYYGDGPYSLTASLAPHAAGPCPTSGGPAAGGTFTVDARPTLTFVGEPRSHDTRSLDVFRGVRVFQTADSAIPEVRCALDPVVQADGSLRGTVVTHSNGVVDGDGTAGFPEADAFPHAGNWSCIGRAIGGPDDLHTGWSAPVSATIPGDLFVDAGTLLDRSYPTYAVRFAVDRGAVGGTLTFKLRSCARYSKAPRGGTLSTKRLTLHAVVGKSGNATIRFKRRVRPAQFGRYFLGHASFSGTSLIPKGTTRPLYAFAEYNDLFEGPLLGVYSPTHC
jgi:hypothetical protein